MRPRVMVTQPPSSSRSGRMMVPLAKIIGPPTGVWGHSKQEEAVVSFFGVRREASAPAGRVMLPVVVGFRGVTFCRVTRDAALDSVRKQTKAAPRRHTPTTREEPRSIAQGTGLEPCPEKYARGEES